MVIVFDRNQAVAFQTYFNFRKRQHTAPLRDGFLRSSFVRLRNFCNFFSGLDFIFLGLDQSTLIGFSLFAKR